MIPEEKSALIVWRIMVPSVPFEEFERHLLKQRRPEWNQAVGMIADAMREYAQEQFRECSTGLDALAEQLDGRQAGLESELEMALTFTKAMA